MLLSAETSLLSPAVNVVDSPTPAAPGQDAPSDSAAFGEIELCAPPDVAPAASAATPSALAFPLADTFHLHSLAGAPKRIFLDFDGHTTTGSDWNTAFTGGAPIVTPAFSADADAAFTDAELLTIQQIYQRVSEDYIGFNVDVTTEDPGADPNTNRVWGIRVAVGGDWSDWYGSPAGGVAYVGSFTAPTDTPAFVFSETDFNDNKYVAEAISHEVGHTLGLHHDGRTSPSEEYYEGQGSGETGWAPIMGVGYYQNLTQWSKGEYANANNLEDDLAIITSQNGFGYRTDDFPNEPTPLVFNAGVATVNGILETGGATTEGFSFSTSGGTVLIDAIPFSVGPGNSGADNDLSISIVNQANGSVVQTVNPADLLDVHFQLNLAPGTYVIRVSSTGKNNPQLDGYTDYASMGRYSLKVTRPGPEIEVTGNNLPIDDGDNTPIANEGTAFGSQSVASGTVTHTFTIANPGTAALDLTGTPRVQITGVNASDFTVSAQPVASVAAGGTTTFTIVFNPSASGLRTAIVNIANNDSNENPYNFTIAGTGTALTPEIDVRGNNVSIVDGDTSPGSTDGTAFGGQAVSIGSVTRTFTIANTGSAALSLSGTPRVQIGGANASDFTVTSQPLASVAAGGTATFTIAFDPSAAGLRTAIVSIANNDSNENPYNFTIAGTGTVQAPEMDVRWGGVSIADGDTSPGSTDGTAFGSQNVSSGTVTRIFTIANTGSAALNLTGTPRVQIGGVNASDFTVTAQPIASVAAGGTATFTIVFNPSAGGLRTAIVTIANNDSNENPYNFTIAGTGTVTAAVPLTSDGSLVEATSEPSATLSTDSSTLSTSSGTVSNSTGQTTNRRNGTGDVKSKTTESTFDATSSDITTSDSDAVDDVFADPSFGQLLDPSPTTTTKNRSLRHGS